MQGFTCFLGGMLGGWLSDASIWFALFSVLLVLLHSSGWLLRNNQICIPLCVWIHMFKKVLPGITRFLDCSQECLPTMGPLSPPWQPILSKFSSHQAESSLDFCTLLSHDWPVELLSTSRNSTFIPILVSRSCRGLALLSSFVEFHQIQHCDQTHCQLWSTTTGDEQHACTCNQCWLSHETGEFLAASWCYTINNLRAAVTTGPFYLEYMWFAYDYF